MAGEITIDGITVNDALFINEQPAAQADVAGKGQLWVKNATPNELWFTNDAGTDVQLGTGGGGGGGFNSRCRVYRNSTQSIVKSTWTVIQFDTENYDIGDEFDSTTNYRFTATEAGYYHITAKTRLLDVAAVKTIWLATVLNDTTYIDAFYKYSVAGINQLITNTDYYLAANDYVEARVFHNDTVPRNLETGSEATFLSIHRFA